MDSRTHTIWTQVAHTTIVDSLQRINRPYIQFNKKNGRFRNSVCIKSFFTRIYIICCWFLRELLPPQLHTVSGFDDLCYLSAVYVWKLRSNWEIPEVPILFSQKPMSKPLNVVAFNKVISTAQPQTCKARTMAVTLEHSEELLDCHPNIFYRNTTWQNINAYCHCSAPRSTYLFFTSVCLRRVDWRIGCSWTELSQVGRSSGLTLHHQWLDQGWIATADIASPLQPAGLIIDNDKRPDGLTLGERTLHGMALPVQTLWRWVTWTRPWLLQRQMQLRMKI